MTVVPRVKPGAVDWHTPQAGCHECAAFDFYGTHTFAVVHNIPLPFADGFEWGSVTLSRNGGRFGWCAESAEKGTHTARSVRTVKGCQVEAEAWIQLRTANHLLDGLLCDGEVEYHPQDREQARCVACHMTAPGGVLPPHTEAGHPAAALRTALRDPSDRT